MSKSAPSSRDTRSIVVGGDQATTILDQIGAEQQGFARCHRRGELAEQRGAFGRSEVADRPAEEGDEPAAVSADGVQVLPEVADDACDVDVGVLVGDCFCCGAKRGFGHIEELEAPKPSRCGHRVEEQARLLGGTGTELDEGISAADRGDRTGPFGEDRPFGAGGVVLGQSGDRLEQLTAVVVV
jgi:hypothetical protein